MFYKLIESLNWGVWGIRVAFNRLINPYSKLESKIFVEIRKCLKLEYAHILDEQLEYFNVIRRFDVGDVHIMFLKWTWNSLKLINNAEVLFSESNKKETLARFDLQLDGQDINCTMVAINGVLAQINISYPQVDYKKLSSRDDIEIKFKSGKIIDKSKV